MSLYELQRDWEQAIAMRKRLESLTTVSERHTIAQYNCELAQAALLAQDPAAGPEVPEVAPSPRMRTACVPT